jgi:hypothetical protein
MVVIKAANRPPFEFGAMYFPRLFPLTAVVILGGYAVILQLCRHDPTVSLRHDPTVSLNLQSCNPDPTAIPIMILAIPSG